MGKTFLNYSNLWLKSFIKKPFDRTPNCKNNPSLIRKEMIKIKKELKLKRNQIKKCRQINVVQTNNF